MIEGAGSVVAAALPEIFRTRAAGRRAIGVALPAAAFRGGVARGERRKVDEPRVLLAASRRFRRLGGVREPCDFSEGISIAHSGVVTHRVP